MRTPEEQAGERGIRCRISLRRMGEGAGGADMGITLTSLRAAGIFFCFREGMLFRTEEKPPEEDFPLGETAVGVARSPTPSEMGRGLIIQNTHTFGRTAAL